nr:hypothetical protein [Pseudomonas chengduensis]
MPSLKPLKSVAHNVVHQFASTLNYWAGDYGINHLAHSALAQGGTVSIDLIAGSSVPLLWGEGHLACRQMSDALPVLLSKEGFAPSILGSAFARFVFSGEPPVPGGNATFNCVVEFRTIQGRRYEVRLTELNAP